MGVDKKQDGDVITASDWNSISEELTTTDAINNEFAVRIAQNEFENNLNDLNYDGGFFIIYSDLNKVSSQSNVNIRTGTNGKVLLGFSSTNLGVYDDHEDNSIDSSRWDTATNSGSISESNGRLKLRATPYAYYSDPVIEQAQALASTDQNKYIFECNEISIGSGRMNGSATYTCELRVNINGTYKVIASRSGDANNYSVDTFTDETIVIEHSSGNYWDVKTDSFGNYNFNFGVSASDDVNIGLEAWAEVSGATQDNADSEATFQIETTKRPKFVSSGSVTSVEFDLSNDLPEAPNTVVLSDTRQLPDDSTIEYVLEDANGNTKTLTQSDVDTEVDVSNFTSPKISCKTELFANTSQTETPVSEDVSAHFKV